MSTGHDNPELELQIDPEWVDMFSPRILDRGYAYFIDGTVHDIEKSEFGYTAVVEGSVPYHVEVELDDEGTLVDADCDCPYAMDGNWCKHEAALMYALEDGLDEYEEHQSVDTGLECDGLVGNLADDVSLDSVLSSMSREELESLVLELASRSSDIRGLIWERYADRLSSSFILEIRNHIDATIDSIRRTGADEWYDEEDYYSSSELHELEELLESRVRTIVLCKGYPLQAFRLCLHILSRLPEPRDSEYGGYEFEKVIGTACSVMKEAFEKAGESERQGMKTDLEKLFTSLSPARLCYEDVAMVLLSTMKDVFVATAIVEKGRDSAESLSEENMKLYLLSYQVLGWWEEMMDFILCHLVSYAAVECGYRFLKEHSGSEEVISFLLKTRTANDCYEQTAMSSSKIQKDVSEWLLDIYRSCDRQPEYADELEYNILHISQNDIGRVLEFKSLVDESRWKSVYERLRHSCSISSHAPELYAHLQDWESLMEYVERPYCNCLARYERILHEHFPQRLIALLERNVRSTAAHMSDRRGYQVFASQLRHLKSYDEGTAIVEAILQNPALKMSKRHALKDELRKAGFTPEYYC